MFEKILIANRGEIALRIIRSCNELGIKTVAIHSTADQDAIHVRMSDESVCVGPANSSKSYLNIPAIITAAELSGADAIHPGYGFLSENESFASIVEAHGIVFIGPKPEHIRTMGDKISARKAMKNAGIPLVPGSDGVLTSEDNVKKLSEKIGFPLILKASSGGGGKGMKVINNINDIKKYYNLVKLEAKANFNDDSVYKDREIQLLAREDRKTLVDHWGRFQIT